MFTEKPFKGKKVHFADSKMYDDEAEKKDEKITPLAKNLQKDKCKTPQQPSEEEKSSGKSKVSSQAPYVISLKPLKPLVITTKVYEDFINLHTLCSCPFIT